MERTGGAQARRLGRGRGWWQDLATEHVAAAGAAVDVEAQQCLYQLGSGLRFGIDRVGPFGAEQLAAAVQAFALAAVGQQPVMPDALKSLRQNMLQEAADEQFLI